MGHVKAIVERMKNKAQGTAPVSSRQQPIDLPGLHRAERMKQGAVVSQKREYNLCLRALREKNKTLKSLKGDKKKDVNSSIAATKVHMQDLLTKIGSYTDDERMYGFKGMRDAE